MDIHRYSDQTKTMADLRILGRSGDSSLSYQRIPEESTGMETPKHSNNREFSLGSPRLKAFEGRDWIHSPRTGYTYIDSPTYRNTWTPEREVPMPNMARLSLYDYNDGEVSFFVNRESSRTMNFGSKIDYRDSSEQTQSAELLCNKIVTFFLSLTFISVSNKILLFFMEKIKKSIQHAKALVQTPKLLSSNSNKKIFSLKEFFEVNLTRRWISSTPGNSLLSYLLCWIEVFTSAIFCLLNFVTPRAHEIQNPHLGNSEEKVDEKQSFFRSSLFYKSFLKWWTRIVFKSEDQSGRLKITKQPTRKSLRLRGLSAECYEGFSFKTKRKMRTSKNPSMMEQSDIECEQFSLTDEEDDIETQQFILRKKRNYWLWDLSNDSSMNQKSDTSCDAQKEQDQVKEVLNGSSEKVVMAFPNDGSKKCLTAWEKLFIWLQHFSVSFFIKKIKESFNGMELSSNNAGISNISESEGINQHSTSRKQMITLPEDGSEKQYTAWEKFTTWFPHFSTVFFFQKPKESTNIDDENEMELIPCQTRASDLDAMNHHEVNYFIKLISNIYVTREKTQLDSQRDFQIASLKEVLSNNFSRLFCWISNSFSNSWINFKGSKINTLIFDRLRRKCFLFVQRMRTIKSLQKVRRCSDSKDSNLDKDLKGGAAMKTTWFVLIKRTFKQFMALWDPFSNFLKISIENVFEKISSTKSMVYSWISGTIKIMYKDQSAKPETVKRQSCIKTCAVIFLFLVITWAALSFDILPSTEDFWIEGQISRSKTGQVLVDQENKTDKFEILEWAMGFPILASVKLGELWSHFSNWTILSVDNHGMKSPKPAPTFQDISEKIIDEILSNSDFISFLTTPSSISEEEIQELLSKIKDYPSVDQNYPRGFKKIFDARSESIHQEMMRNFHVYDDLQGILSKEKTDAFKSADEPDFMKKIQGLKREIQEMEIKLDQLLSVEAFTCCLNQTYFEELVSKNCEIHLKDLTNRAKAVFVSQYPIAKIHISKELKNSVKLDATMVAEVNSGLQEAFLQSNILNFSRSQGLPSLKRDEINSLIQQAIATYDADKTGLFDFALESAGGAVVSTRCTESYLRHEATYTLLGLPIWWKSNNPRTAIQPGVIPGQCWAFKGSQGFLVIQLSTAMKPTRFSLEHIPRSMSPTGKIDSAPKEFEVYGHRHSENDPETKFLGNFVYDHHGDSLQYFTMEKPSDEIFFFIELRILSNNGNPNYTCLYRFRVHGNP